MPWAPFVLVAAGCGVAAAGLGELGLEELMSLGMAPATKAASNPPVWAVAHCSMAAATMIAIRAASLAVLVIVAMLLMLLSDRPVLWQARADAANCTSWSR